MTDVPNPWAPENWNLTAQGAYVTKYGISVASRKARQAGTKLGAPAPRPFAQPPFTVIVQHKGLLAPVGGGGLIGAGSSGSGDPT